MEKDTVVAATTDVKDDIKEAEKETEKIISDIVEKATTSKSDSVYTPNTSSLPNKEQEPLEKRIHTNWLADYIKYTAFQESPTIFHLWTGISVIAATLNRNVYIQRGYNRLYPNLYTVLVSPTGKSKKTSAANIGVNDFLQKVDGVRISRDETTPKGLVQYLAMSPAKRDGSKLYQNCTAYIYAAELSDLLGEQTYNQGLIKKLTAFWDCPNIYDDTTKELLIKQKEPTRLTNVCLNLFGCSNPEWLAHGLKEDSFGGGFMGRTLFVYSNETRKTDASAWMEVPPDISITQLTLLRDLQKIGQLHGSFRIDNAAYKYFIKLYKEYEGDFSGRMAGYLERKLTFVLKLAMIISINFSDDLLITKEHIDAALQYLDTIEKMMPQAFVYINATNEARIAQHIIESIKESGGAEFRYTLVEKFRHLVRNIREFDDILQMLIESRIIKQITVEERISYVFMAIYEKLQKEKVEKFQQELKQQEQQNTTTETIQ